MPPTEPSRRVIKQRIRNRLIEYLEMVVSYTTDPPPFDLNEVLNQWEDWVPFPAIIVDFPAPTYTQSEAESLIAFAMAWDKLCSLILPTTTIETDVICKPEWLIFLGAANTALHTLAQRGRLSEDTETQL